MPSDEHISVGSKDLCCNPGGIGPLLSSIVALGSNNRANQEKVVEELDTLAYMSNSAANCRILGQIKAVSILVPFLSNWGSTLVASKAAAVIRHLATSGEALRAEIVAGGAVPKLASLLLHGVDADEKGRAAQAICVRKYTGARVTSQFHIIIKTSTVSSFLYSKQDRDVMYSSCYHTKSRRRRTAVVFAIMPWVYWDSKSSHHPALTSQALGALADTEARQEELRRQG
eukprot:scaffold30759_cov36-Prasinocladus_malaysianus.AAC.3